MAVTVYSDNQKNVDELAERLTSETSFDAEKAKLVAHDLLCRKALKIKSSALAQIFRSVDKECDTKAMRDELLAAQIVTKIEGSGVNGRPAFYTINAVIAEPEGDEPAGETEAEASPKADEGGEADSRTKAVDAQAERFEHVDTDDLVDENVVRAFTSKVGRGFSGGGKRDAQRRAQQERFRRAVAQKATEESPAVKTVEAPKSLSVCEATEPKAAATPVALEAAEPATAARVGSHFKRAQAATEAKQEHKSTETDGKRTDRAEKPEVKGAPAHKADTAESSVEPKDAAKTVQADETAQTEQPAKRPNRRRRSRKRNPQTTEATSSQDATANTHANAPVKEDEKQSAAQPEEPKKSKSAKGQQRASSKRQEGEARKAASKEQGAAFEDKETEQHANEKRHGDVSPIAVARVLGRRILKAMPNSTALAKIREQQTDIVKVERKDKKPVQQRPARNDMSNRKIAEDVETVIAWVERTRGTDIPFASRRQRAYQIFNDEKAFEGKRGERLVKRLGEKGITMLTLKVTPNRPAHFTGFYALGADKPFIMVENLDTYDEIVKLLRGRRNAKLFGTKVGGVIFGGGCKASVSHALDDYLAEIGYRFSYVYYVGDIDREGAKIVEQARNANVVEIRLHAGMYRAMIAEHKRRVKAGGACEPAAANQGVPQNLAATIKDLPMVTRVQFRNILREGGRIPQEILMTADYRDGDSGSFDRMLNK